MHYSPSDKDGVFVVEVARGADTSYHSPQTTASTMVRNCQQNIDFRNTSEIHHPALVLRLASENTQTVVECSTGLSQSDLSESSSTGSNRDYIYGDGHELYYEISKSCNKNIVTAAIHTQYPVTKQETIDLEPRLQSDIDLYNMETERSKLLKEEEPKKSSREDSKS